MSFGQRFKITPIQMATAVCAVANNGVLIKPRIVKEIKNTDTGAITTINTAAVRQVISKTTAETMMDLLETVVTDGSGKYAKIKGYSIAGKTGTSEPDYNKTKDILPHLLLLALQKTLNLYCWLLFMIHKDLKAIVETQLQPL